jgi:serine-type D-Ala-D-Ala carboxypeptidase (penicillin-binding protein 5/6)
MTDKAGSCMAVTTKRNGLRLIAITLGFPNSKVRNQETMDLLDYGFNQYETKIIKKKNDVVGQLSLEKANKDKIDLVLKDDAVIINKKQDKEKDYTYDIKTYDVTYPIKKDTVLGELQIKDNNKIVSKVDLVSNEDIDKLNIFKLYLKILKDILIGN